MAVIGVPNPQTVDPSSNASRVSRYSTAGIAPNDVPVGAYFYPFNWIVPLGGGITSNVPMFYIRASQSKAVVVTGAGVQCIFSGTAPASPVTPRIRAFHFTRSPMPSPQANWQNSPGQPTQAARKRSTYPAPSAEFNIASSSAGSFLSVLTPDVVDANEMVTFGLPLGTAATIPTSSDQDCHNIVNPGDADSWIRLIYPEGLAFYTPTSGTDWATGFGFWGYIMWEEYNY